MIPDRYRKMIQELTRIIGALRFGIVMEVDYSGDAEWNTHGFKPGAQVIIIDHTQIDSPPCRVMTIGATAGEGFWWPLCKDQVVIVSFLLGMDTPVILGTLWSDRQGTLPSEADENTVVMKFGGHKFLVSKAALAAGIKLETAGGLKVLMEESGETKTLTVEHPMGTKAVMNQDGDLNATVKRDLVADVTRNVDVEALGTATVYAHGKAKVQSDDSIDLEKTGQALAGILTALSHPVCMLMGTPNGASQSVRGSS